MGFRAWLQLSLSAMWEGFLSFWPRSFWALFTGMVRLQSYLLLLLLLTLYILSSCQSKVLKWLIEVLYWCLVDIWPNIKGYETIGWVFVSYSSLNTWYSKMHCRLCFAITSLFHLWRNYIWGHNNSCFWSFVEVFAWYAPPCRHGLSHIPLPIDWHAQVIGRMLTPITGCGEVWLAKSVLGYQLILFRS